ncbi:restriction endonuclease subunit S [Bosea lathyri]|uniref:Type I restriction enzyme, S subunit n=1 Tax=Bosea lathyri TaxID=1036778 RepID=A0A1H6D7N6_9HYPH|nr:restriction endonuclease subunit S [Bosea lathyri]SEG81310.1 type I restriction enzyme, S subunit [Bosea lathyri]
MSWPAVAIGEIVADLRSGFASGGDDPEGVVQFRMNNVERSGELNWSKLRRVPRSKARKDLLIEPGDILFNATNSPDLVGKTALFCGFDEPVTFSNHFLRLRSKRDTVDPTYLSRWLQREFAHGRFAAMCRSWVNQASITKDQLASLEIPLPPFDEQRRVAAILDNADAMRRKRKRVLKLLRNLGEALFRDTFVIAEEGSWPTVTVGDLAKDMRTGPFGSQLLHSEFVSEGVAVIGIDNAVSNEFRWAERRFITEEKFKTLRRYQVYPGDLIITIMGTCGRCAIIPEDVPTSINTKHLCCITLDKTRCLPEFLHAAFLCHPDIKRQLGVQAKGAVMPGLNMGIIKSLALRLPPLRLQRQFVEKLEMIAVQSVMAEASEAHCAGLFSSLQHRAFTGQL